MKGVTSPAAVASGRRKMINQPNVSMGMGYKRAIRELVLVITSLVLLAASLTAAALLIESLLQPWGAPMTAAQLRWLTRSLLAALGIGLAFVLYIRHTNDQ